MSQKNLVLFFNLLPLRYKQPVDRWAVMTLYPGLFSPQLYTFPWHTDWLPQTQPPPPRTRKCCRLKKKNTPSNLQFWVSPQDKGTTYTLLLSFSSPRVKLFCTSWEKSSLEKSFIACRSAEGSGVDALIVLSLPSNVFQNDLKAFVLFYAIKQILLHSWKFSKFS